MKSIATIILLASMSLGAAAQTTITNGGFENWGNASPGLPNPQEPTSWYSNKSGSVTAQLANPTCFKDSTDQHSGNYCVKIQTITYLGIEVVNGVVTTGVVNAPSTNKDSGYIGTVNYSNASDDRRMPFTGRPDSLIGWYKYTPGGAGEKGKIRAILHTGDYYDPETPTNSYHPIPTANKIADDTFFTPTTTVATWTRFSIPFTYVSSLSPAYIMINATSSANQATTVSGSILWLDDLAVVYNSTCAAPASLTANSITSTSAVINWTNTGVLGSEYVVNTTATAPTGSGAATTGTTYSATGLTPSTTYYAHVRDSCGSTSLSSWSTISFSTSPNGIKTITNSDFAVSSYPNPVKDELTIKINGVAGANGQVQLMDVSGRVIKTIAAKTSETNMSTSGLPVGIYLVRYSDAEHIQTMRINKQ